MPLSGSSAAGIISPVVEELLSSRLVAVERLSWEPANGSSSSAVGPVRLVFDTGHGLVLAGSSAWTLSLRVTGPGDDSWLETYDHDFDEGRWVLRDASAEEPFAPAKGAALTDWQPIYNEVQEVVGLRLWFDGREMPLTLRSGKLST